MESDSSISDQDSFAIEVPAYEPCSCKTTCSTKTTEKRRGCPCKTAKRMCLSHCKCGTRKHACKNKVHIPKPREVRAEPVTRTEDEERARENHHVKAFLDTLDEPMVRRLAVKSLQRGIGSMEYIQSMLLQEDDPTNDESILNTDHSHNQSLQIPQPSTSSQTSSQCPDWCKCGTCKPMPQEIENKCCKQRNCVTLESRFSKLVLDPEVLELCIKNRADIRNDREDNSTRAFRKAAYRQYILGRYNYLGKGNRKVAPSCVVCSIRDRYPSATGVYMGFRAN